MFEPRITPQGIEFQVRVQPKASANAVAGVHENALKLRLTAPPVDNAANKMCIRFLARQLKIPASRMEITAGRTARSKTILIRHPEGESPETSGKKILAHLKALTRGAS